MHARGMAGVERNQGGCETETRPYVRTYRRSCLSFARVGRERTRVEARKE